MKYLEMKGSWEYTFLTGATQVSGEIDIFVPQNINISQGRKTVKTFQSKIL